MQIAESTYRSFIEPEALHHIWQRARYHQVVGRALHDQGKSDQIPPLDLTVDYIVLETGQAYQAPVLKARHRFELGRLPSMNFGRPSTREIPSELAISGHGGTVNIDMTTAEGTVILHGQRQRVRLLQPKDVGLFLPYMATREDGLSRVSEASDGQIGRAMRQVMGPKALTAQLISLYHQRSGQ